MPKNDLKTRINEASVEEFLDSIDDEKRRADSFVVLEMMKKVTKAKPKMWGASMIGFGSYHYTGASGREGDWFCVGFSPRKANISLHFMAGAERFPDLMKKLGKVKTGKGCVYMNKLEDIDLKVLAELVKKGFNSMLEEHNGKV